MSSGFMQGFAISYKITGKANVASWNDINKAIKVLQAAGFEVVSMEATKEERKTNDD